MRTLWKIKYNTAGVSLLDFLWADRLFYI